MFDLVADMERYPQFVPLCLRNVVRAREAEGAIEVVATDMTVVYAVFCETFRTRVTLDRINRRIFVESNDGPLRRLRIEWTFQSRTAHSSEVGFYLSYDLASRTLALLMGAVFDAAFRRLADAFEQRADVVYAYRRGIHAQSCATASASIPGDGA
jgi:coenzyme Q-binding protein COQ10